MSKLIRKAVMTRSYGDIDDMREITEAIKDGYTITECKKVTYFGNGYRSELEYIMEKEVEDDQQ